MKKITPLFLTEEQKQKYLKEVEPYKDLSFDFLWDSVPPQTLPRSNRTTFPQTAYCLECGENAMHYGHYPFIMDFINNRWKIVCPSCGLTFPTNDFEAYYKGGLDENGIFQPELAKKHNDELIAKGERGNLVNILYPEKGEHWGVDAGTGYLHENGIKYTFIACYMHFVWNYSNHSFIPTALTAYANAYSATGDIGYAEKAVVLLDRVADIYPTLSMHCWKREDGYSNSNGGDCDKGKAVGRIWETIVARNLLNNVLAFGEVLEKDLAPNAVAFLRNKNPEKDSAKAVLDNIMKGIAKEIYPGVKSSNIYGNSGMHQHALALAAIAWDKLPETKEWLDFLFQSGVENDEKIDGGNMSELLVNRIDRDGYGTEAAPGYNSIWLNCFLDIAKALDGYQLSGMKNYDLYNHPKFRKMLTTMYPLILSDIYTINIGDSGSCANPGYTARNHVLISAFLRYGTPEFAQAAYYISKNNLENMDLTGFPESPAAIAEKVRAVIEKHGTLKLGSTNLTGYGFIALRDGKAGDMFTDPKTTTQRALSVYYGKNFGHGHRDTLNLTLFAYGLNLMPDIGYPRYADSHDKHRYSLVDHTLSHNTVTVNENWQTLQVVGDPLHFDASDRVKLFDVSAPGAYNGIVSGDVKIIASWSGLSMPDTYDAAVDTYRRSSAMIKIDEQDSYVIDFFRVSGGSTHCYSFHGAEQCGIATEGLSLTKQADANGNYVGTYAGADIEYPVNADVLDFSGAKYFLNIDKQSGAIGDFSVDYNVCDTWDIFGNGVHAPTDVHLKLTMLGEFDEVTLADILPPENKPGNPKTLRYVLARRRGENLKTCYTALIEPYRAESRIASAETMTVTENGKEVCPMCARAVKVTLKNGRVDYIVNAVDPNALYTVSDGETEFAFSGFFGVWTREAGRDSYYLNDGTRIGSYLNPELSAITGTVVDFTRELATENEIVVTVDQAAIDTDALSGKLINVENSEIGYNTAYQIKSAALREDGKLVLDIGDVTLIRSYVDAYDFSKGYVYAIAEGKPFRIPLAKETK